MNIFTIPFIVIAKELDEIIKKEYGEQVHRECKFSVYNTKSENIGDYQTNVALILSKLLGNSPKKIAEHIKGLLEKKLEGYANCDVSGPGFIVFYISSVIQDRMMESLYNLYFKGGDKIIIDSPLTFPSRNVVIDYSSPNIAKPMHVGHLRSTVIGDALANMIQFIGHNVSRVNHVGDWGTQFGLIIAYVKKKKINLESIDSEEKMLKIYKLANELKKDNKFLNIARQEVVKLQIGNQDNLDIWKHLCDVSYKSFNSIYNYLGINIEKKGESIYQKYLSEISESLLSKKVAEESDGAICIFSDKTDIPFIIKKSDGGFGYAATDLAAIRYRAQDMKADWIIYVTDHGQQLHFKQLFYAANKSEFTNSNIKLDHAYFGTVNGLDGKRIKTRDGNIVYLKDLLSFAKDKALFEIKERRKDLSDNESDILAKTLSIGGVKFSDLICNRASDYTLNFDRMFKIAGKSSIFINYTYVRLLKIISKSTVELPNNIKNIVSTHIIDLSPEEVDLIRIISKFTDSIYMSVEELMPSILATYIYNLTCVTNTFIEKCKIIGSDREQEKLILAFITAQTIKKGMNLLGIQLVATM